MAEYWSRRIPDSDWADVTELVLEIYRSPEIKDLFAGKKTKHQQIYQLIAERLQNAGFPVPQHRGGTVTKAGDKIKSKIDNLKDSYLRYIKNVKQTGAGYSKPPKYLEALTEIWGGRYHIHTESDDSMVSNPLFHTSHTHSSQTTTTQTTTLRKQTPTLRTHPHCDPHCQKKIEAKSNGKKRKKAHGHECKESEI
uniref:Myb/SANT-like DNA-binding domain-containing protein n=1 Tax=Cacopsylla melanoneura TaxID=428564 RepID=A0A8D9AX34_9HEMI